MKQSIFKGILFVADISVCRNFLKDLLDLFDSHRSLASDPTQYLERLPISENVKSVSYYCCLYTPNLVYMLIHSFYCCQVELTQGSGVYIPLSIKEQLKVDYKDKPNMLAKNTLFALYGREAFRTHQVTGRGNKSGTYSVEPDELKAVLGKCHKKLCISHWPLYYLLLLKANLDWMFPSGKVNCFIPLGCLIGDYSGTLPIYQPIFEINHMIIAS